MVVSVSAKKKTVGPNKFDLLARFARRRKLTLEQHRVGAYLIARLSFGKAIHIPQRKIADLLNIQQPNVSRAIQQLIDLGLISEGQPIGPSKTYLLQAAFAKSTANA